MECKSDRLTGTIITQICIPFLWKEFRGFLDSFYVELTALCSDCRDLLALLLIQLSSSRQRSSKDLVILEILGSVNKEWISDG